MFLFNLEIMEKDHHPHPSTILQLSFLVLATSNFLRSCQDLYDLSVACFDQLSARMDDLTEHLARRIATGGVTTKAVAIPYGGRDTFRDAGWYGGHKSEELVGVITSHWTSFSVWMCLAQEWKNGQMFQCKVKQKERAKKTQGEEREREREWSGLSFQARLKSVQQENLSYRYS